MKKLLLLLLCIAFSIGLQSQSDKELSLRKIQNTKTHKNIYTQSRTSNPVKFIKRTSACDSLLAVDTTDNGFDGNMFDVVVKKSCEIETFSVNIGSGTWNVGIFYRTGTFVGHDTSSNGWIFLDSAKVTSTTNYDTLYKVPVSLNLPVSPGIYAFYVTITNPFSSFNYLDGTGVGNVVSSDTYLSILEGHGGQYPFDVTYFPRIFSGRIYYCDSTSIGIDETSNLPLNIFPNPASNYIEIDFSKFNENEVTANITNTLGQVVLSEKIVSKGIQKFDLTGISNGVYILQIANKYKILSKTKLLINK